HRDHDFHGAAADMAVLDIGLLARRSIDQQLDRFAAVRTMDGSGIQHDVASCHAAAPGSSGSAKHTEECVFERHYPGPAFCLRNSSTVRQNAFDCSTKGKWPTPVHISNRAP